LRPAAAGAPILPLIVHRSDLPSLPCDSPTHQLCITWPFELPWRACSQRRSPDRPLPRRRAHCWLRKGPMSRTIGMSAIKEQPRPKRLPCQSLSSRRPHDFERPFPNHRVPTRPAQPPVIPLMNGPSSEP
jgi:hypothetical protein